MASESDTAAPQTVIAYWVSADHIASGDWVAMDTPPEPTAEVVEHFRKHKMGNPIAAMPSPPDK